MGVFWGLLKFQIFFGLLKIPGVLEFFFFFLGGGGWGWGER